jgi:hypothetical protein
MTRNEQIAEVARCYRDPVYFANTYGSVYDARAKAWIPFHLWEAQVSTLTTIADNRLIVILKARQLGLTWLVLSYALWLMLFHPAATVLLFSKRDDEATDLLDFRLKGIYARLPEWMRARSVVRDSGHEWELSNGSRALAFPTTGGRSYTATLVIVDEADFIDRLGELLNAVKPTIDAGGQLVLLSTADKSKPQSEFKAIYREAKFGGTNWKSIFLPWSVAPWRTPEWYELERAEKLRTKGSEDDLWQEYPASDDEALAPATLDKRIPAAWIRQCYTAQKPITAGELPEIERSKMPAIPGLEVYQAPQTGRRYVIGADPAEGNPTSDDSALTVLDAESWEEVAALAGKYDPAVFAGHMDRIGRWYNSAGVLVERNNHGHAVLLWLRDNSTLTRLAGHDEREGWLSNSKGKTLLYDCCADAFRDGETTLHSFATMTQLQSIEGATLLAPEGERDDRADSYALAVVACSFRKSFGFSAIGGGAPSTANKWVVR